jgi:hypothetical protein
MPLRSGYDFEGVWRNFPHLSLEKAAPRFRAPLQSIALPMRCAFWNQHLRSGLPAFTRWVTPRRSVGSWLIIIGNIDAVVFRSSGGLGLL